MNRRLRREFVIAVIAALAVVGVVRPSASHAQSRPAPVAEVAAGLLSFPDDSTVNEGFVGGALRFHLSPRISVGPEVAYISGDNHNHLMLTGNATFDLASPVNDKPRRITPFAVVGGGLFRTRERVPNNEVFAHNEGAFTAGGGVRALVGDRVTIGVEARVGWELHLRVNGLVGVRLAD